VHYFLKVCGIVTVAVGVVAIAPNAIAQENIDIFACQFVGGSAIEPLGDREGHAIRVVQFNCLGTTGPLTGGIFTGSSIYELEKTGGVLLSGAGVIRKPGATTVYQLTGGKLELIITDGKVTGVTSSGQGIYQMAIGSAASLAGKSFTYTSKPTAPGQFEIDVKRE
jgi:hypothetical protein